LCSRSKPAKEVADEIGVSREVLYNWKRQLLKEGCEPKMTKKDKVSNTSTDVKHEGQTTDLLAEKEYLTNK
jgi:putative transposase